MRCYSHLANLVTRGRVLGEDGGRGLSLCEHAVSDMPLTLSVVKGIPHHLPISLSNMRSANKLNRPGFVGGSR